MSCPLELAKCEASYLALRQQLVDKGNELAAAQAREKELRDALERLANNLGEYSSAMQTQQQADVLTNYANSAFSALAKASDDTALRAALAAERERCAQFLDDNYGPNCAMLIRDELD